MSVTLLLLEAFAQGDGIAPSDAELTVIFSAAAAAVAGIALYAARDVIFRRGIHGDPAADSGRNRDYEKYHSDWSDDYGELGKRGTTDGLPDAALDSDYYGILGVPRDATPGEIKARFRELAKKLHPDRSNGDPESMAEINRAYEILSDDKLRREYDRLKE